MEEKNIIENALLLKQNRADLVAALNDVGFHQVNEDTPLSDIARYMKWAGGLLDIRLATFSKATRQHRYWTYDEWMSQSAQFRSSFIQMGVVIRAECQEFILARADFASADGTAMFPWSANSNNDVRGLTNFLGLPTLLADMDGEANTDLILAAIDYNGVDYPAARLAREYRCCSIADGGVEDPTTWSLPALGQLFICYKYLLEINAALNLFGLTPLVPSGYYWSSTEASNIYTFFVYFYYGIVESANKLNQYRLRPVARVSPSAATL